MTDRNWNSCHPCRKRGYLTRRGARAAAKTIGGPHMTAYRCPHSDAWHLGHMPRAVVHGAEPKAAFVRRAEQRQQGRVS